MRNKPSICKDMNIEDCELQIIRLSVDKAEKLLGAKVAQSSEIKQIIHLLEVFLQKKSLICYGGTAINNILPKTEQFYDQNVEVPDYDFFSYNAIEDAKELSSIYFKNGFTEVEAKSGQHHGTYKVFVNFMPIADITFIPKELFVNLKKTAIKISGIYYAPPNYLRMSMFLELSRPNGDVSRWEKVFKRLKLLNKHYPLYNKKCFHTTFQRELSKHNKYKQEELFHILQNILTSQNIVFFGGYALSLYSKYMPEFIRKQFRHIPDFDVLSENPKATADNIKEELLNQGIQNVSIVKHKAIGELIGVNYEILIDKDTVGFIYEPKACHSYNIIRINKKNIKIATIDTILSFYLAFLYANKPYYDTDRILCMATFLFDIQEKNKLQQIGLLKRFTISCFGHQESVEEMKLEKSTKFNELKNNKNSKEFEEWFLNFRPDKMQKEEKKEEEEKHEEEPMKHQKKHKTFKHKKQKKRKRSTKKLFGIF
jgi:hypothetical protein